MTARTRGAALLVAAVMAAACAQVLGLKKSASTHQPFPHRAHAIKGGIQCTKCHEGIGKAGDSGPLHIPDKAKCMSCHEKAHHADQDCADCHGGKYTRVSAQASRDNLTFTHTAHMPRVKGNCVRCHEGAAVDAEQIRPPMALCLNCHAHSDWFTTRKCDGCHADLKGEHVTPSSHLAHDGEWIREHGVSAAAGMDLCVTCHSQSSCTKCHGVTVPVLQEKLSFDDPTRMGAHRAGFFSRHAAEARLQPGLCSTCHSPKACDACHEKREVKFGAAKKSPHPKGWLSATKGGGNDHGRAAWLDPVECASCHGGAGEAMCIGCHKVGGTGGNPHRPGFDSKLNKLTDQPCRLCHGVKP